MAVGSTVVVAVDGKLLAVLGLASGIEPLGFEGIAFEPDNNKSKANFNLSTTWYSLELVINELGGR